MSRLWFYELFDAVLFLRLMSVGKIATWVFLDSKRRALSKRGVVYNYETSVFKTEKVDGRQWKGFYVVSYSDEPCLGMVIFLYAPSVLVWKFFVMDWGGGGRSEHIPRVVYKTLKQWKLLRYHPPSSTLLVLIGTSPFAFNKYPHKPYIFWKLNSSRLLLLPFKKSKY